MKMADFKGKPPVAVCKQMPGYVASTDPLKVAFSLDPEARCFHFDVVDPFETAEGLLLQNLQRGDGSNIH